MKKKYNVTGMMCAACQANVDRAVCKIDGVTNVNVSLLANNMVVEFDESKVMIGILSKMRWTKKFCSRL